MGLMFPSDRMKAEKRNELKSDSSNRCDILRIEREKWSGLDYSELCAKVIKAVGLSILISSKQTKVS